MCLVIKAQKTLCAPFCINGFNIYLWMGVEYVLFIFLFKRYTIKNVWRLLKGKHFCLRFKYVLRKRKTD